MSQPYNSLNPSTGFDLEEYERKMLSSSKSFFADIAVSFSDSDAASLLEAYEKKLLSGQMMFDDDAVC
ncbi:MAG TPA: hypothetical protein VN763_07425 [Saprospiraceae bacterium]|jgi:hypothetical protein|nr:hypothetical protein [Chitinophagaceae bacterium]HXR80729.1 hypothetical protein [Saprospiraceae bacterium]